MFLPTVRSRRSNMNKNGTLIIDPSHSFEGVALARPSYGKLQRCLCACAEARVLAWEGRVRAGV